MDVLLLIKKTKQTKRKTNKIKKNGTTKRIKQNKTRKQTTFNIKYIKNNIKNKTTK